MIDAGLGDNDRVTKPSESRSSPEMRRGWPIRVYRLGAETSDDLSGSTTAEQRLAMMWPLTVEAWSLSGRDLPQYVRYETPITTRRSSVTGGVSAPQ